MEIEDYGFSDEDIEIITSSFYDGENNFKISEEKFEEYAERYLKAGINWIIQHENLILQDDDQFDDTLKNIARQIAINSFMQLDIVQSASVIETEHGFSIPLSKANVITDDILKWLEPYLRKKDTSTITIITPTRRDYGF